jgi:arginine repressor
MFEELFLTKEEEKLYQLDKLEKSFILSQEEMLKRLKEDAIEKTEQAKLAQALYWNYKKLIEVKPNSSHD